LSETRSAAQGFYREVCDQLDRASLSFLLNTAEGNGKRQGKQLAKFFDDARGSAGSVPRVLTRSQRNAWLQPSAYRKARVYCFELSAC
jgi:four helix bundle protein